MHNEPSILPKIDWLVSDWQFGETPDRLRDFLWRPFESEQAHNEALIRNHNAVVKEDDVVLCLGDVTYQKSPESLPLVSRLNGRKLLVRGNHDRVHSESDLREFFELVVPDGKGLEFTYNDIKLYGTHYPSCGRKDRFNIVGHVHGLWRCQLNMINVSVDSFGYAPLHIAQVPRLIEAITKYYDDDVWAAYLDINSEHRSGRGAKSRYFSPPSA